MKKIICNTNIMLILVFFLASESIIAENCDISAFNQKELTIVARTAKCVRAADLNGDGKLDIVSSSSGDNKLAWYQKIDNGRYLVRVISTSLTGTESLDIGDLDGDGDNDIVAAAYTGNLINWYENDGTGNFTPRTLVTAYNYARFVRICDLDSDGSMDIIGSSVGAKTVDWFDNNGDKTFTKKKVASGITTPWYFTIKDIDNDADLDVVVASRDGNSVLLQINDGNEVFTQKTIDNRAKGAEAVDIGDVNNDGYMDIISASYWEDKIVWYKNDGSLNFVPDTITLSADGIRDVLLFDVDKDNDLDVVYAANFLDKVAWFENDGSGNFNSENIVNNINNGPQFVSCYDLDSDGNVEYLVASSDDNQISLTEYENGQSETQDITFQSIGSETSIITDLDSDGDFDVLVTAMMGEKVFWLENLGKSDFLPHDIITNTSGIRYAEAADMNKDGYNDVIIAESKANTLSILYNNGTQDFSKTIIDTLYNIQSIVISDINKDGLSDIVTASRNDNKICWFKQLSSGKFEKNIISDNSPAANCVFVDDFNKDGYLDVLATSINDDVACWYKNDGNCNFTQTIISKASDYPSTIESSDLDKDGDKDCVIGSKNDNSVAVLKNDGSMNFTETVIDNTIKWVNSLTIADLNLDTYPDIITASSNDNTVQWYKNNQAGGFVNQKINRDAKGAFFVDAGDMDGDTDIDLISSAFTDDKVILYSVATYKDYSVSLSKPENNAQIETYDSLKWTSAPNATAYWLQASLDSNFNTISAQDTVSLNNIIASSIKLIPNKKYFWRVSATNGTCWTRWSNVRVFNLIETFIPCEITLKSGWNMISAYVTPKNDSLKVILSHIKPNSVIIKDNTGKFYLPQSNTGTLKFWISTEGYKIYMSKADTLSILGKLINPQSTPIKLKAGWNIMAYLRKTSMNAKDALTSILSNFVIVKNSAGKFFIPPSNNMIGDLLPGQGYQIYAKTAVDLYYPANSGKVSVDEITIYEPKHFVLNNVSTDNNLSFILETQLDEETEIGVFNEKGFLVGSGVVENGNALVVVYGDDKNTLGYEGALLDEKLSIKSFSAKNGKEMSIDINSIKSLINDITFKEFVYKPEEVIFAKSTAINNKEIKNSLSVNPNPVKSILSFNVESVEKTKAEIKIIDLSGKVVKLIYNGILEQGTNTFELNCDFLNAGAYIITMTTQFEQVSSQFIKN